MKTSTLLAALIALGLTAGACSQEPQDTGGATLSSGASSIPEPASEPPAEREVAAGDLLWRYDNPHVDMVVVGGGIVLLGVELPRHSEPRELQALDVQTGEVLWRVEAGSGPSWRSSNLRLVDGVAYFVESRAVSFQDGSRGVRTTVRSIDTATGDELWLYGLTTGGRNPQSTRLSISAGTVNITFASTFAPRPIFALDAATGRLIWETTTSGIVRHVSGGKVYIEETNALVTLDGATGDPLWQRDGRYLPKTQTEGIVIAGSGDIVGLDSETGEQVWHYDHRGYRLDAHSVRDGIVVAVFQRSPTRSPDSPMRSKHFDGALCTLDAKSGALLWCKRYDPMPFDVGHTGRVVYVPSGNRLDALDAKTGRPLWTHYVAADRSIPKFADGILYFGTLDALDPATGTVLWRYRPEAPIAHGGYLPASLTVAEGIAIVLTDRGVVALASPPAELPIGPPPPPAESCGDSGAVPDPQNNPGLVKDCEVLLSIRNSLAGSALSRLNWSPLDWSPQLPIAEWDGVSLIERERRSVAGRPGKDAPTPIPGQSDRVRELQLPNRQLSGAVPPELGSLSELVTLELGDNDLGGEIPPEIGQLSNLKFLDLGSNEVSGGVPPELAGLSNLEVLILHRSHLDGEIPPWLGDLLNLEVLDLWGAKMTGKIPPELGSLSNLEVLILGGTKLTGKIPPEMGGLSNLEVLILGGTKLTGKIPPEMGRLSNLERLSLAGNRLSGEIPAELGSLINLEMLNLRANQLHGEIPAELGGLSNLQGLDLSYNQLSGEIPSELANLPDLGWLVLDGGNQLTGCIPAGLRNALEDALEQKVLTRGEDVRGHHLGSLDLPLCETR